jgi:hypothetical protein
MYLQTLFGTHRHIDWPINHTESNTGFLQQVTVAAIVLSYILQC